MTKKTFNLPAHFIESLESRTLLSAAVSAVMTPNIVRNALAGDASSSGNIQGFTPSQIEQTYGFDSIGLANNVTPDGAGQTIAIVDAFNDPSVVSDLAVFDKQFNLPAANLKIINQTGGSTLPSTDPGWSTEIALDVEWAHAVAPQASLLLVEASSANTSDLMTAVDTARHAAGVSVVSMSWGGSEDFSWGFGESTSQTSYDTYFTTPAGHENETFVVASGDSGTGNGVQWPASSPNVVSVGGTTLDTQTDGAYLSETGWNGTSGGDSQVEGAPAYQQSAQDTPARTVPDVAYDADPTTGFAVYDSVPYEGYVGWQEVGGTSAGTPQWAALFAITDQARQLVGKSTLDGPTQTLPMLYSLYANPQSAGYATYSTVDFHDVTRTDYGGYQFRWGGFGDTGNQATYGYDYVTGLGSPQAPAIVNALAGTSFTHSPTSTAPLIAAIASTLAPSAVDGSAGSLKLSLINQTSVTYDAAVTVNLYLSSSNTLASGAASFTTIMLPKVSIHAQKSKLQNLKFTYPASAPAGSYYVIATVDTSPVTSTVDAASLSTISLAPAFVDLAATFKNASPFAVNTKHANNVIVVITNMGNVTAIGTFSLQLDASSETTVDSTVEPLGKPLAHAIHLKAGRSMTMHLRFTAPSDKVAGMYNLLAALTSSITPADNNPANDTAVLATM